MAPAIGIIPAAGRGTRLGALRYPKELLPVCYEQDEGSKTLVPRLVIDHSLEALRLASVERCVLVISRDKTEIPRALESGPNLGPEVFYAVQSRYPGLSGAIAHSYSMIASNGHNACLVLPDTLFAPISAVAQVRVALDRTKAELVLGLFPTRQPHELGPVETGANGRVVRVWEKPSKANVWNTWGVAAWTPCFFDYLKASVVRASSEVSLGEIFNSACEAGLDVRAVSFASGVYRDLGTPAGLAAALVAEPSGHASPRLFEAIPWHLKHSATSDDPTAAEGRAVDSESVTHASKDCGAI